MRKYALCNSQKTAEKRMKKQVFAVNVYKLSKNAAFFAEIPCFSTGDVVQYG